MYVHICACVRWLTLCLWRARCSCFGWMGGFPTRWPSSTTMGRAPPPSLNWALLQPCFAMGMICERLDVSSLALHSLQGSAKGIHGPPQNSRNSASGILPCFSFLRSGSQQFSGQTSRIPNGSKASAVSFRCFRRTPFGCGLVIFLGRSS